MKHVLDPLSSQKIDIVGANSHSGMSDVVHPDSTLSGNDATGQAALPRNRGFSGNSGMSDVVYPESALSGDGADQAAPPRDRGFSFDFFSAFEMNDEAVATALGEIPGSRSRCHSLALDPAAAAPSVRPRGDSIFLDPPGPGRLRGDSIFCDPMGLREGGADPPGGARPRGDSIIFDPTSFCDGGIHETTALRHIKQEDRGPTPITTGVAPLPNELPRLPSHPVPIHSGSAAAPFPLSAPPDPASVAVGVRRKGSPHSAPRAKDNRARPPRSAEAPRSASLSAPGVRQTLSDHTIQMPHGSAAAAAAAAGMPRSSASTSLPQDGVSLSHTSCPMELLNKGGRIGIYLPEERQARIAKFHSKRALRIWRKRIKYDCRKKLADSRPRIKGRFVKREDVPE